MLLTGRTKISVHDLLDLSPVCSSETQNIVDGFEYMDHA